MSKAPVNNARDSAKDNRRPAGSRLLRSWLVITLATAGVAVLGTLWVGVATGRLEAQDSSRSAEEPTGSMSQQVSPVFTTARRSFLDALKEYFSWQSKPVQPVAFNHKVHVEGLECLDCHTGAAQGPDAGIPSVSFCMSCHQAIAVDNPEIKKLTAYADKGQEPPWEPVFWFYPGAHVRFRHAPHVRNGVDCKECHGDMSQRTVAVRTKDLSMKFCLDCHKAKGVSVDCIVCHN